MSVYPFNSKRKTKKNSTDPKGYATVKDFKKGDFIRLTGKKGTKTYIRGDYDRELKKSITLSIATTYTEMADT